MQSNQKKIEDFLNEEVYDYSLHVIQERALPCVIDGFKPSQRKIIYTARKVGNNFMKTTALAGYVSAIGNYERGDQQLPDTIIRMVQNFAGKNNIPFLDGEGSFGSRFIPDGAAAPRYTKTRLNRNFHEIFSTDFDVLTYTEQGNDGVFEPDYYVPTIPAILLNGPSGIAVGFACEFQPYLRSDLIRNTAAVLAGKSQKTLRPFFQGYKGEITWSSEDQKWRMFGVISHKMAGRQHTYEITEIPVSISREKYVNHLELLIDKEIINDYTDLCNKNGFNFKILVTRSQVEKIESRNIFKIFNLIKNLNYNMNCISEDGKLLRFYTPEQLVKYFVDFRLTFLSKRKAYQIKLLTSEGNLIQEKISFIINVRSNKISMKFKSRADMKKQIQKLEYKYVDKLMEMAVYSITEENIKKLEADLVDVDSMLEYYTNVTEKGLFISDLQEMK